MNNPQPVPNARLIKTLKSKGCPTPYLKAMKAHNDPDGRGWYIVILGGRVDGSQDSIWDVLDFGPEWLQIAPAERHDRRRWVRWQDLEDFQIVLDGDPI